MKVVVYCQHACLQAKVQTTPFKLHPTPSLPNHTQRLSPRPSARPHRPSPSSTISTSTSHPGHPAAPKPASSLAPATVPGPLDAELIAVVDDLCSFSPCQSLPTMPLTRSGWLVRRSHFSVSGTHERVYCGRLLCVDGKEIGVGNERCLQVLPISHRIR